MGRYSTGAVETDNALKFDISRLFEWNYLEKGVMRSGTVSWSSRGTTTGRISIVADLDNLSVRLIYTITSRDEEVRNRDYEVRLIGKPSNLGKGLVYYFLCPVSGKPCRILYSAYGSDYFKSREAYRNRLYYPLQACSKLDRANTIYWETEYKLTKRKKQRRAYYYAGKPTKRFLREQKLYTRMEWADEVRWSKASMPKRLWDCGL